MNLESFDLFGGRGEMKIKKVFLVLVTVISLVGISYSLYSIYQNFNSYQVSAHKYKELEESYYQGDDREKSISDINEDFVGWIDIEDTNVSYPVVQTVDNEFYLNHNFYKEQDFVGAIFMDYRMSTDVLDKNIIVYGHNMKDGSMFGNLKKYLDHDYYQDHKYITLDFLDASYEWEVVSIYSTLDTNWMENIFIDEEEFGEYVETIIDNSVISTGVEVDEEDVILTLSTCTTEDREKRFIVHAKLINEERQSE